MPKIDYVHRILTILKLLKEKTDQDHGLSSREIARILCEQYNLTIDPRSVRSIITNLAESGFPIETKPKYYYAGLLSVGETEYLTQAVRFGSGLTSEQKDNLVNKIINISANIPDRKTIGPCRWMKPSNSEMLSSLETIRRAINDGRQISFEYAAYDFDGNLVTKSARNDPEKSKRYNASPYHIICANGRYYLLASVNNHKEISHYRIDRMLSIQRRRALSHPCTDKVNTSEYIVERPYMYTGPVYKYRLRVTRSMMNNIFDRFGYDIKVIQIDEDSADVIVFSDAKSMQIWTGRYGGYATIIKE